MIRVVAGRVAAGLAMLFVVSVTAHLIVSPGIDAIARNILGEAASDQQVAEKAAELGLDQPLVVRYAEWLAGALHGDLGTSYYSTQPVIDAIAIRLPVTLSLIGLVTVTVGMLAFAVGLVAASRRGWVDRALQVLTTLGDALPSFVIGIFLATVFALQLRWLPATGYIPFGQSPSGWAITMVLPVAALTITGVAGVAQHVRSAAMGVIQSDYVRTLRSRGLSRRDVLTTSVLRNAAPTGLSALALQIVGVLGGAVVVEQVFALPGLGFLGVQSALRSDVPVMLGVLMTYVVIVIVVNILVELAVAWVNPKVRISA